MIQSVLKGTVNAKMKYSFVFWDWNGTIIDDAAASMDSMNLMLARRGMPPINMDTYRDYVDIPIIKFYEKAFDMSRENMDSIAAEFNSGYELCLAGEPLREGACEVLRSLYESGVKQYIFSSSHGDIVRAALKRHGIGEYFEAVLGSGDYYAGSKLERTREYIVTHGIAPERTVFIGDMEHDREVASACGSDCVLLSGGHRPESALRATGSKVVGSLYEFADYMKEQ